jgi:hypothetical protein
VRTSLKAALTAAAASLALLTPTMAFADTNSPDGDTVAAGRDINYGAGARDCSTRGTAVAGQIRIEWQGGQHFTAGEALSLTFSPPAGVTVSVPGTPTVPLDWNDTTDSVVIPFSTTVSTTSDGGKVDITLKGASSNYNPGGSPNFQVNVACTDTTAPVIAYSLTPSAPSPFGWYAGPVVIDWTVTDPESPVTLTGCADETWSSETTAAGHDFTCSASSAGGSAGPVTVNVKIDSTQPTVVPVVTGSQGSNDWYTSDATLHWNVSDTGSGLVDALACPDVPINTDQVATTYSCTVTDKAGNTKAVSTTVKRDASAPLVGVVLTGTMGANGWYTSAVDVDWTVTEPTSAPVSLLGCADQTVTDTAGVTLGCKATNDAGLSTTAPDVQLKVDATAPVVSGTPSGTLGSNGWYTGNVTVHWSVTEHGSGATACADDHQNTDTTGVTFHCQVTDAAGNVSNDATVTVKRDATSPSLTPSVVGPLGEHAWYIDNVSVGFSYDDATSLIDPAGTSGCDPAFIDTDTAGVDFDCVVFDLAGNKAESTFTIKRDATAPVISHNDLNPDGLAGWFLTHPSIDWTVTEGVSGPAVLTGCDDIASVPNTNGTEYSCSAKNQAGLEADDAVTLMVDTVAPVVSGTPSGALGLNGWYVDPATVTWDVTETGSGATPCDADLQSDDTTGVTFDCQVSDTAGNVSNKASVTVKIDATDPTITPHVTGDQGAGGWYTGDVSVSFDTADATSGVASETGCDDAMVDTDTADAPFDCTVTDEAGNSNSSTFSVKRDASKPEISHNSLVPDGNAGWFVSHPALDWTVTDLVSGIGSSTGCDDVASVADSNGTTYTCEATNGAGLSNSDAVTLKVDTVAPVVSGTPSGTLGDNGWYVGDVTVTWGVTDTGSGATPCAADHQTVDTGGATFDCQVSDVAGNVSNHPTVTVIRDATKPDVSFATGPADGATYFFGDPIPATSCSASDATSGLAGACTVTPVSTSLGSHTVTAYAKDKAGNERTVTRTYTVGAWTLGGFYNPVNMNGVVNTVKAGSTVPLKFNVSKGTNELTAAIGATFKAQSISCSTLSDNPTDPVEITTTGGTSLRYDTTGHQWIQNWATPSSGKGLCYRVTMTTADGSALAANFQLR